MEKTERMDTCDITASDSSPKASVPRQRRTTSPYTPPTFFKTSSPDRYGILKDFAKKNRQHQTDAERALWSLLSGTHLGVRFRRQHIIGDYIADFACLEKKLIIEVDGAYHFTTEQIGYDIYRTESLGRMGFHVLRFTNEDVLFNTTHVLNAIIDTLENIKYIIRN